MEPKSTKKSKSIKIVLEVSITMLVAIMMIVSFVSCSNTKKITLDEGCISDYSWSKQVKFHTTAYRETKEGAQTFYVTLSVYGKNSEKIYLQQQAFSFEDFKYMSLVDFEIDKWLIPDYQTFDFVLNKKFDYNLDKPQDHHSFKESIITSPTCTTSGTKKTTCSHCSISKTDMLSALGHKWIGTECENCKLKMKNYKLTISESLVSNNHVGNSWSQTYKYNNEQVGRTFTVTAPPDSTITVSATITEHDEYPDVGHGSIKVVLTDGITANGTVVVQEDRGKYARNKAKWCIMISVEEIK